MACWVSDITPDTLYDWVVSVYLLSVLTRSLTCPLKPLRSVAEAPSAVNCEPAPWAIPWTPETYPSTDVSHKEVCDWR